MASQKRSSKHREKTAIPAGLIVPELYSTATRGDFELIRAERFNALALWGLPEEFVSNFEPVSHWSACEEAFLGMVFKQREGRKFGCAIFARDAEGRTRELAHMVSMPTARAAEDAMRKTRCSEFEELLANRSFPALKSGMDLFQKFPRVSNYQPAYRYLRDGARQSAAKRIMQEIAKWVPDRDGNFVRDFQTTGYSARVWELYLYAAMRELNFSIDLDHAVPDFCLSRGEDKVFVEAVTVNSPDPLSAAMGDGPPPLPPEDFWAFIENEMPVRFGSPLFSKVQKKYWAALHVQGHPFVLAIADFHARSSMIWSHTAVPIYLFGRGASVTIDDNGTKRGTEKIVNVFHGARKSIAAPFFDQPDTENISAVLFSNAGTISKFNRMGVRAGFGDRFVQLTREGGLNDPHPGAFEAIPFRVDIESASYSENWADELEMYHNPKALHPIADELFPGITHFRIEDDESIWRGPSPRVLFSWTHSVDLLSRPIPGQRQKSSTAPRTPAKKSRPKTVKRK